ncbi:MAG TPA: CvpA family protein [Verrucomicrobiae bacterium]|nr:CvpA family protein [Verrucomicrobiae bacterium]
MIAGVVWADVFFAAVLALATLKGFARGFVKELGGLLAIAAATIAPWYYNGSADLWIARTTGLGAPFAHALGMFATSVFAYFAVLVAVWIVGGFMKLPVLGLGNKIVGALVGCAKGYALLWALLYVALFFPLTPQLRAQLHASHLAPYLTVYDATVDRMILSAVPPFAREYLEPYVDNHHL